MRHPDPQKRQQILDAASRLFASGRYDRIKLDDVAAAAGVGKGTLYIYFDGKEDLYFCLIYEAVVALIERLREQLAEHGATPAAARLRRIVQELVEFSFAHPQVYELMRTVGVGKQDVRWREARAELTDLIRQTIADGVGRGEFRDSHPELTAVFVPGFVRSALLFGADGLEKQTLVDHILQVMFHGILKREEASR
jgi:AcrR family transcriptional regulator